MTRKISEEIARFHEMIALNKKVREETQTTTYRMLEEMQNRIIFETQNERKEREQTEETILRLLEETCQRVETVLTTQYQETY